MYRVLETPRRYVHNQDTATGSRFHAPRNGRRDFLITASKKLELIKPAKTPAAANFPRRQIQFRVSA